MSDEIRSFLERMSSEMPGLGGSGPRVIGRARRAATITLACVVVIASGLGVGAFAGIRTFSLSRPATPAHRLPSPRATPSFADGDPCPPASDLDVPSGAGCLTIATGDFDGDGVADRFLVYADPLDAKRMPVRWHMVSVLDGGAPVEIRSSKARDDAVRVRALGSTDLNGDGRPDVLVRLRAGADTGFVGVYLFIDGAWHPAGLVGGKKRLSIAIGGSALYGSGGYCASSGSSRRLVLDKIVVHGDTAPWAKQWYRWEGFRVRLDHVRTGRFTGSNQGTAQTRFREFRCGPLALH